MNRASPKLRERLRDAAQGAILDAAEAAFAEVGIEAPMELIATKAGVAVGTLYNHFASRAALLEALLTTRRRELLLVAAGAVEAHRGQPFSQRLTAVLRTLVAATEAKAQFRRIVMQADLPTKHSRRAAVAEEIAGVFTKLLEEGRAEGALAADPAGLQGIWLSALVQAALATSLHTPEKLPLLRVPEVVAQQFIDGARPR